MISRIDIEDMTDAQDEAPERIWAARSSFGEHSWMAVEYDGGVPYVRADLARPSQEGDEMVAERIAIALWRAEAAAGTPSVQKRRNADTWADQTPELRDRWMRFARAALAAMDTPKGGGDGWQPIETCASGDGPVLIYNPGMESDPGWPSHAVHVSNREYVTSGNAKKAGFTAWHPVPPAPPAAMKDGGA